MMDIKEYEDNFHAKRVPDAEFAKMGVDVRTVRFRQALDVEAAQQIVKCHQLPEGERRAAIQEVHDRFNDYKQTLHLEDREAYHTQ